MSGIGIYGFDMRYGYPEGATMRDVHSNSWGADSENFNVKESSGGSIGIDQVGGVNAIYGPELAQLAFVQANALSIIPQAPFRLGRRVEWELAVSPDTSASTVRGGAVPSPQRPGLAVIETPHKVCTTSQVMELGMVQMGTNNSDDIAVWEKQILNHGRGFVNNMNAMILSKIETPPVTGQGALDTQAGADTQRTGLESLERIFSNADEAQYLPETYAVPWFNDESNRIHGGNSMMEKFRSTDSYSTLGIESELDDPMGGNVIHSYDETTTTGVASDYTVVSQNTLSKLYNLCAPWWENNSTNGKAFVTGYDTLEKLQAQSASQQRFLNTEYVTFGLNGVNTINGRDIGLQVASYAGIPIIPDRMMGKGDTSNPTKGVGRIGLYDLDALARGTLIDMNIMVTDNRLIARSFNRVANYLFMGEIQTDKFKSSGKAIHLA